MKTKITANKQIFTSLLISYLFGLPLCLFSIIGIFKSQLQTFQFIELIFLVFWLSYATLLFIMIVSVLPSEVVFDSTTQEIEITYLWRKHMTISLADISHFTYTKIWIKNNAIQGDFIYLKDNKKILISEFSLIDHRPFEKWLEDEKVPYNGEEKGSLFSYYFQYLKRG